MNLFKYILMLFFISYFSSYSQVTLNNYYENTESIILDVILSPKNYTSNINKSGETIVDFNDYDLSKPGLYSQPQKDIFIALPGILNKVDVNVTSVEINKIKGKPVTNPLVSISKDSSISYDFNYIPDYNHLSKNSNLVSPIYQLAGFLWVRNFYCIHIKINQYRFNNNDVIEELRKVKISIKFKDNINSKYLPEQSKDSYDEILSNLVVNYNSAKKLKKPEQTKASDEWIDYDKTYLKIGIASDGIYRITRSDMENFGINVSSIDPSTFKIFLKGNELPIKVGLHNDNIFDNDDYIEFIGKRNWGDNYREVSNEGGKYKEYLNIYSDTTIYWLTWGGDTGKRINSLISSSFNTMDTLRYYTEIVHYEQNQWLDYSMESLVLRQMPQWKKNQTWVWGQQYVGTANRTFKVNDIFPNRSAKAFYKVQSFASNISKNAHKIGLSINNDTAVYDSSFFDKYQQRVVKAEFSSGLLKEGNNTLKTISYPTAATINSVEYDWYEVEYPKYLAAINDSLKFSFNDISGTGLRTIEISNVISNNLVLYKDDGNLRIIKNYSKNGNKIVFNDSVENRDTYYLISESRISSPHYYYLKNFKNITDPEIQADYILITHPFFLGKANQYADFLLQNYSVETQVINVIDIYDQFNYGFFAPEPIRDFLKNAYNNWKFPKPTYLLLLGDATYDYYGNKTKYFDSPSVKNFVPSYGEPVSDTWYVIWDSTAYIPQLYSGRLPVNSIEEFDHYFEKHKTYLTQNFDKWNKRYLFFSGGSADNPSEINQLKQVNDYLINNLVLPPPIGGIANHLYKTHSPKTNFGPYTQEEINRMISEGGLFISYIGHSGTQIWDNGINDIVQLKNAYGRKPLITDFGCSTGKFAEPDIKSFSELFVGNLNGEAIGYIGNSSLGFLTTTQIYPRLFYNQLLNNSFISIGEAHVNSKIDLINSSLNETNRVFVFCNTFVGDPIINLQKPVKPNLNCSSNDIIIDKTSNNSDMDSLKLVFHYFNLGKVDSSSFQIQIIHRHNDSIIEEKIFDRILPNYNDSLFFYVIVKNLIGNHVVEFNLDYENSISEIYENDNSSSFSFNYASRNLRTLFSTKTQNKSYDSFYLLNPVTNISGNDVLVELDTNYAFSNPYVITKKIDSLITKINLKNLENGKRYWFHSKLDVEPEYGEIYSFVYDSSVNLKYFINDSVSFTDLFTDRIKFNNSGIILDNEQKHLLVSSAGFYEGNYAVVEINGNNYLNEGHLDGPHIVVFDDNFNYEYTRRFSYWDNTTVFAQNFKNFLDTIPSNKIVIIANSGGGGSGFTQELKNAIKNFGSIYADSIVFRCSWILIGRKGAAPGTVPEVFSRPYQGSVQIDSIINVANSEGLFKTSLIGPSNKWKNLKIVKSELAGSKINIQLYDPDLNISFDTLEINSDGLGDLSHINAQHYPYLKILVEFNASDDGTSPILSSLGVDYTDVPELATNYQVVSISQDSLVQGDSLALKFFVYNVGESPTDSFKVKVELVKPDNSSRLLMDSLVTKIDSMQRKEFNFLYRTASYDGTGNMKFKISIDYEDRVLELYEDNNIYEIPFLVKPDTTTTSVTSATLAVTFDGINITSGDYVSSTSEISFTLSYPVWFPVYDSTAINFLIDNQQINFSQLDIFTDTINRKAIYKFKAQLEDGEHFLSVFGKNIVGTIENTPGYEVIFNVSNEMKLMNVYNYPNPCKGNTNFTFTLTQIPDDLKIKILTVAGRLIKEIDGNSFPLHAGFNIIPWDGKDQDSEYVGNGVYFYKVIVKKDDKSESTIQKLAVVR